VELFKGEQATTEIIAAAGIWWGNHSDKKKISLKGEEDRIIDSGDYALMSTSIAFLSGWVLCNIVLLHLNKFVFGYYCILILCKRVDEMGVDKMEQK